MDIKSPIRDATGSAKQSIDSAAGQLQSVADQTTKQLGAVGGNVQKAVDLASQSARSGNLKQHPER